MPDVAKIAGNIIGVHSTCLCSNVSNIDIHGMERNGSVTIVGITLELGSAPVIVAPAKGLHRFDCPSSQDSLLRRTPDPGRQESREPTDEQRYLRRSLSGGSSGSI